MSKKNKNLLILKIQNDNVFYNEKYYIPLKETNFPRNSEFKSNKVLFWKTKITNYDSSTKTVYLNIINYNYNNVNEFSIRKSNGTLKKIVFNNIQFRPLEEHLGSYMPSEYSDYRNLNVSESLDSQKETREESPDSQKEIEGESNKLDLSRFPSFNQDKVQPYNLTVDISDIEFLNGLIRLKKERLDYYRLGKIEVLEYPNINIKETYSSLLPFISKVLKKNEIEFKLGVKFKNDGIENILSIESPDLELINDKIIHESKITAIKYRFKAHKKNSFPKEIFEIKDLLPEDPELAIQYFINQEFKNHGNELNYLSKIASQLFSIRYTFSPDLSYIFLVEKDTRIYFILETVNTNFATYIWNFNKADFTQISNENIYDLSYNSAKLELIKLKEIGRQKYKRDTESKNFEVIEHKNTDSDIQFWKEELENILK